MFDVILVGWPSQVAEVYPSDEPCTETTQGGVVGRFDTREAADDAAREWNAPH